MDGKLSFVICELKEGVWSSYSDGAEIPTSGDPQTLDTISGKTRAGDAGDAGWTGENVFDGSIVFADFEVLANVDGTGNPRLFGATVARSGRGQENNECQTFDHKLLANCGLINCMYKPTWCHAPGVHLNNQMSG